MFTQSPYKVEYDHETGCFSVWKDDERLSEFATLRAANDYVGELDDQDYDNWLCKHHPRSDWA